MQPVTITVSTRSPTRWLARGVPKKALGQVLEGIGHVVCGVCVARPRTAWGLVCGASLPQSAPGQRSAGQQAAAGVCQQLVKIVHDELVALLGERREGLRMSTLPPTIVMLVGLQGSGKTTTTAKLARKLKGEGRQTRLVALDVYRPAAIDQLETLGRDLDIPVFADRSTNDVEKIARAGIELARHERDRVVLLDTAGRITLDEL